MDKHNDTSARGVGKMVRNKMRLILARNKAEAYPYIRPGDKYLAILPDDLFGHADCDLIEVGNYWARPDFKIEEIYYYCVSHKISMSSSFVSTLSVI